MFKKTRLAFCAAALAFAAAAHAAPGDGSTIKIGRTGSLTGVNAPQGIAGSAGIKAYFDEVNAKGGVGGRQIEFLTVDDGYKPAQAKEAATRLIEQEKVFAMILSNGTGTTNAILPLVVQAKIPLIGSTSGSIMRKEADVTRYFFNVRNSNYDDTKGITSFLSNVGDKSIAVIYQEDAFGKAAFADMQRAAKEDGVKISAQIAMPADAPNPAAYLKELMNSGGSTANNIALLLIDRPVGGVVKAARAMSLTQRLFAITSSGEIDKSAGVKDAENVIVSQTAPAITDISVPAVYQFRELMARRAPAHINSVLAFEGFMAARVMVEGLKEAGPNLTRESLISALERFKSRDFGGIYYSYDTPLHTGTSYQNFYMFGKDGKFIY